MKNKNENINPLVLAFGEKECWINWNKEMKDGKPDKIPKRSDGQGNAKPDDPSTWHTFAEVDAVRNHFDGIGIMLNNKILGVDIDHCIINGEVSPEVAAFIEKARTYTEISPSGTGLHVYLPLTEDMTLVRKRAPRGIGKDYECYVTGRWFTFSSSPWKESYPLRTVTPAEALELLRILGYPWKKDLLPKNETETEPIEVISITDEQLLNKMFTSKNGAKIRALYDGDVSAYGGDESSADMALCAHLAFWVSCDREKMDRLWLNSPLGARQKTQNRKDYRERTIEKAVDSFLYSSEGEGGIVGNAGNFMLDEKQAQKMELMQLVTSNSEIELFRDNYGNGHARVVVDEHKEIIACKGTRFRQWLNHRYLEKFGNIADPSALAAAINAIESTAIFKGKEYKLYNRLAKVGDTVWLDLADARNRAVRITPTGWDIVDEPPILFRRHAHQKEQVEPERGGDINKLFDFINVTEADQKLLLLVYLVSCFIPDFPHALLYIHGQQGSSKSTLCKILRRLVDPSRIEVLHMPKDERELKLQLFRHHLIFYDNVDKISDAISAVLCIGVTGGSSSERLYFTNGEDFLFDFQLNISLNGINISAVKPDLLERSLLFGLNPVEENKRRDEAEIYAGFEAERPKILGAILDTVVKALAIRPGVNLVKKPRMADFAIWGIAISEALGHTKELFLEVYGAKIREQSEEALVESVEATALLVFMKDKTIWKGTAQELLNEFIFLDFENGDDDQHQRVNAQQLPKQPQILMRELNTLKPNLLKIGIKIDSDRENGIRIVTIIKVDKITTKNDKDGDDNIIPPKAKPY